MNSHRVRLWIAGGGGCDGWHAAPGVGALVPAAVPVAGLGALLGPARRLGLHRVDLDHVAATITITNTGMSVTLKTRLVHSGGCMP